MNINGLSSPVSDKYQRVLNKHSLGSNDFNYPPPLPGEESNKGNFTLSSKSGLTFEESN